jgi:protein ImuB
MKRILAVWLPNWPVQRLVRVKPELEGQPLILHQRSRRGQCVAACSRAAWQLGVRPDMPIAEASTLVAQASSLSSRQDACPTYCTNSDPVEDRMALEKLAAWCHRFSPLVGLEDADRPETLLLDVTGVARLFGGEQSLVEQVKQSFRRLRLEARVGLADTVGAAWALATSTSRLPSGTSESAFFPRPHVPSGRRDVLPTHVPSGRRDVLFLPLAALRLPPEMVATLARLGLEQIGDLVPLPRAELQSRFGPLLLKRLDQALGNAPELLTPVRLPPDFTAERSFEYPIAGRDTIDQVVQQLVERLCFLLQQRGEGVLRLTCRLDGEKGVRNLLCAAPEGPFRQKVPDTFCTFEVSLFRPSADAGHLWPLVAMQMERLRLPGPLTNISIRADRHASLSWQQQELFDGQQRRKDSSQVASLVDWLAGRLGRHAVVRCELESDAQPEMAWRDECLVGSQETRVKSQGTRDKRRETRVKSQGTRDKSKKTRLRTSPALDSCLSSLVSPAPLDRPLHLLARPAELQVLAVAPDGPPVHFRYGGRQHKVSRHWGPERIETGWWRNRGVRRDYYRVETTDGHRFWLFRHLQDGHWFLHGSFD